MDMDKLEQIATTNEIFADKSVLIKGSDPESLKDVVHRDDLILDFVFNLKDVLVGNVPPSHIILTGKNGTGKTMTTNLVVEHIRSMALVKGHIVTPIHIKCQANPSDMAVLKMIISELEAVRNVEPKIVAHSLDAKYAWIIELINMEDDIIFLIFDEINKMKSLDRLNVFARIKEDKESERNVCIIGTTNDAKFEEKLDPKAKSAFSWTGLVAPPYDAEQLSDILVQRAEVAFKKGVLHEMVIPLTAAFAAQDHGDARKAIDLLRVAGEIAERKNADTVTEEDVKQALNVIEKQTMSLIIRTLPKQSKLCLLAVVLLRKKHSIKSAASSQIYDVYVQLASALEVNLVTQRRVADLIAELDELGVVNVTLKHRGKYGRTTMTTLSVNISTIIELLEQDLALASVMNYDPILKTSAAYIFNY